MTQEHFESPGGGNIGLIVGLFPNGGAPSWFGVFLIKASPVRHLCLQFAPGAYYPMANTAYGDFYHPKTFLAGANGLIQNRPVCLLGHVLSIQSGGHSLMISPMGEIYDGDAPKR